MKFLKAYLRAVRDYDGALKDGKIAGPGAEEIIQMLGEMTGVKDLSIFRDAVPPYMEPNGAVSMTNLQTDLDYFKELGLVKKDLTLARVDVDLRVIEEVGACDRPVAARAISGICPRAEFELWYRLSQVVRVSFPEPNQLLEAVPGHHVRGVVHASTGASRFNGE